MRLFKPKILILFVLLIVLFTFIFIIFYKLSAFQVALSGNINISDFKGFIQDNFRTTYILLAIICSISIITLLFFILIELSKKLNIFYYKNKSISSINDEESKNIKNNKSEEEKQAQQQNQIKSNQLLSKINEVINNNEDINKTSKQILVEFAKVFQIVQGEIYLLKDNKIKLLETYAYFVAEGKIIEFEIGDGLIGQVAKEKKPLRLDNIPENYINVASGLGKATPSNLIIFPIIFEQKLIGIIELASFIKFSGLDEELCMNISAILGKYYIEILK